MKKEKNNKRSLEVIAVVKKYKLIKDFKAENLRKALEELGPSFIKIGQMAAMRSDILPEDVCDELKLLCSDVKHMPFSEVKETLKEAYDGKEDEIFASIDEAPHGAASLAQVHYAVLKTGESVAIKVQRPYARESMLSDIETMESLVKRFKKNKLVKTIDLKNLVRVFKQTTLDELDFIKEANNINEYRHNIENVRYCETPIVYDDLCRTKVLVMERVDGPHINDFEQLHSENYDFSDLASKYVRNMMKQVIVDGLVQFDPHPANIKVRNGKLVWLDWGMAGHFNSGEREMIRKFYLAMIDNDAFALTNCFALLNENEEQIDKSILYEGLKNVMDKNAYYSIQDISIGKMVGKIFTLLRKSHVLLPSNFVMLMRSFGTMQAVTMSIDPDADLAQLMVDGIKTSLKDDENSSDEVNRWLSIRKQNFKKIATIPVNLADMLQNMSNNLSGFKIDMNVPDKTMSFLFEITDSLIQGLVIVALIISSSIISASDINPKILNIPYIGFIGYLLAIILSIILIIRNRRR